MLYIPPIFQLWLLWAILSPVSFAQIAPSESEETTFAEPTNNPPNDEFLRRAHFEAAVVGDFVYFDGGAGSQVNTERDYNPVNATLSIDLSKSWDIGDVEIIETTYTSDEKQVTYHQALMVDPSQNSFYAWGGLTYQPINDASLWRFDADGDGGGEWLNVTPNDEDDDFYKIKRSNDASVASTHNAGFIFGGSVTRNTDKEPNQEGGAGYRVFNFTTKKWSEERSVQYAENNFLMRGSAVFAPGFGHNGLIFLLGGLQKPDDPKIGMDFQSIWFMDPVERKWYKQTTTGSVPGSREHLCSVGVSTSDGRFDIFVFGGSSLDNSFSSEVYVLSLPGFHWAIAHGELGKGSQRSAHACAVVGQRQFLSFGGIKAVGTKTDEWWRYPDPWTQGIGIFDMSSWSWEGRYNAGAESYAQNKKLRDWYDEGGLDKVEWSDGVEALFVSSNKSDPGDSSGGGSSERPGSDADSENGNSSNAGVIAGSTVGGAVAVAAVVVGWLLWRRYRRRKEAEATVQFVASPPEMGDAVPKTSLYTTSIVPHGPGSGDYTMGPSEMPSDYMPAELASSRRERYELG